MRLLPVGGILTCLSPSTIEALTMTLKMGFLYLAETDGFEPSATSTTQRISWALRRLQDFWNITRTLQYAHDGDLLCR